MVLEQQNYLLIVYCRNVEPMKAYWQRLSLQKFADHLPLYRIAENLRRIGNKISRKLLSQWVVKCGMALKPLLRGNAERDSRKRKHIYR